MKVACHDSDHDLEVSSLVFGQQRRGLSQTYGGEGELGHAQGDGHDAGDDRHLEVGFVMVFFGFVRVLAGNRKDVGGCEGC